MVSIPTNKELKEIEKRLDLDYEKKKNQLKTLDEIRKKHKQIKDIEKEINPNIIQRIINLFRPKIY